jgi:hypothetical protein
MAKAALRLWRRAAGAILLATALAAAPRLASADPFIVQAGQPQAEIVISQAPPRMVKLAAEELQTYVEKITGAKLAVTTAPSDGVPVQIYVGMSPYTERLGVTDDGLRHGAFRMVSGDNWLALVGHDGDFTPPEPYLRHGADWPRLNEEWDKATGETFGYPYTQVWKEFSPELGIWENDERGSLNAVYEFLRMQGVRWYLPDPLGEIVPKTRTIELPRMNKTVRPDFALRFLYQYGRRFAHEGATRDEILWQLRLGLNEAPDVIGLAEPAHGINDVHCRDEVKQAHPEYFALFGGKRDTETFGAGRPCLSSEGLLQANVRYARAVFDIFHAPMVSVMPQDGYVNLCQCDLCKGKDTPERGWDGQISDYVWDYVNRVARELYKTHPDRKISCFAYGAYQLPPLKIDRLSPNVVVGICQARRDFYNPEKRQHFADLRKAWLDKLPEGDKQLIIYDYYLHTNPANTYYGMPVFFPHTIAEDLRSLKGISIGEFIEVYREVHGIHSLGVDGLNLYVTSRLWWDADQDVDALLEEYYTKFYGPAREEMKAFVSYCEANWMDLLKSPEKIDQVFALLGKAQQKVAADSVWGKRIALVADYIRPLTELRQRISKGRENVPEARALTKDAQDIRMDGELDDPFWQDLPTYTLCELKTGAAPAFPTSFKVAWAGDSLYVGIRCEDPDLANLNIGTTRSEDPNIWNGDCVELLLETQTHSYYQLAINPAGALMDLDRKEGLNSLWSSGAEVAAHVGDGYWALEVRVPVAGDQQEELDALNGVSGRRPSETYPWYFNVCRQRVRDAATELSAFSPTGEDHFHEVMKFGKLTVR